MNKAKSHRNTRRAGQIRHKSASSNSSKTLHVRKGQVQRKHAREKLAEYQRRAVLSSQARQDEDRCRAQLRRGERPGLPSASHPSGHDSDLDDQHNYDFSLNPMDDAHRNDILEGRTQIDISHGGIESELLHQPETIVVDLSKLGRNGRPRRKRKDAHKRRERVMKRVTGFEEQKTEMVDAFGVWNLKRATEPPQLWHAEHEDANNGVRIKVVDMRESRTRRLNFATKYDRAAAALISHGAIPSAPYNSTLAFAIDLLEDYHILRLNAPTLSIQSFVAGVSKRLQERFIQYLAQQFSIAYNLYLDLTATWKRKVAEVMHHNSPNWRLAHACPACMYKLRDEPRLKYQLLFTFDGNDSLKRVQLREEDIYNEETGERIHGETRERIDPRKLKGDFFLSRDEVDRWARDGPENVHAPGEGEGAVPSEDTPDCVDRWKNAKTQFKKETQVQWSIFEETGLFLVVCRHHVPLIACDMVRSGEQAKYPLACLERMLEVFGFDLGLGYDVGCGLQKIVENSSLSAKAKALRLAFFLGSFHGHAHNRLCQLQYLVTYQLGLGQEDLEECERVFAQSNALAASTRHMSEFHRHQAISLFFEHFATHNAFANLSDWLYRKYKTTLKMLKDSPPALHHAMKQVGVSNPSVFEDWRKQELAYLEGLKKEPPTKTIQMDYLLALQKLACLEAEVDEIRLIGYQIDATGGYAMVGEGRKRETSRRQVLARHEKWLENVEKMEKSMAEADLWTCRWTHDDDEWRQTQILVDKRKYQQALDELEGLLVSRIFEMVKTHQMHTAYHMRKHIASRLQSRSAAIRTSLERFNKAQHALFPHRQDLTWAKIVDYAFLSDFDLLRDSRLEQIPENERLWSTPAGRLAMDAYFKIERAREEIVRLDVEIRRLFTHMHDEEEYNHAIVRRVEEDLCDPALAVFVRRAHNEQARFYAYHCQRLKQITRLPGCSLVLSRGTAIKSYASDFPDLPMGDDSDAVMSDADPDGAGVRSDQSDAELSASDDDDDDAGGLEEDDAEISAALESIYLVAEDDP